MGGFWYVLYFIINISNIKIIKYYFKSKRALLVPIVENLGGVIIFQPRGKSFKEYLFKNNGFFEVDTVLRDGSIEVTKHQVSSYNFNFYHIEIDIFDWYKFQMLDLKL